jgi:hypothetical protein
MWYHPATIDRVLFQNPVTATMKRWMITKPMNAKQARK